MEFDVTIVEEFPREFPRDCPRDTRIVNVRVSTTVNNVVIVSVWLGLHPIGS